MYAIRSYYVKDKLLDKGNFKKKKTETDGKKVDDNPPATPGYMWNGTIGPGSYRQKNQD